jgi:hypothetical protein
VLTGNGSRNEREAHVKKGVLVAARLGEPSFPHVVSVSVNTYHNRDGEMKLTEQSVEMVQALYGPPQDLAQRLLTLWPKARRLAEEGLGDAHLVVDVTRSPEVWRYLLDRVAVGIFLCVTTHGRLRDDTPYWLVGRVTLMSHLATQVARGVLRFVHPPDDDPRFLAPAKVRDALTKARTRAPASEADEFLTETTTDDDVGLVLAAAAMYAERFQPAPWIDLDARATRFADEPYPPDIHRRA